MLRTATLLLLMAILVDSVSGKKPLHTIRAKEIRKPSIQTVKQKPVLSSMREEAEAILGDITQEAGTCLTDLMAGQHYPVGVVSTKQVNDTHLNIAYDMSDTPDDNGHYWHLTEVHYSITSSGNDLPPPGSAPGQYEFKEEGLFEELYSMDHSLEDLGLDAGDCPYLAFHSVVESHYVDLDEFAACLPDSTTMVLTLDSPDSYWKATLSGETVLDGVYDDWCADHSHFINPGSQHVANVYSSYETLPEGLVGEHWKPENLPKVNWVINQNFVGQPCVGVDGCTGDYTKGDVQKAIWMLLEGTFAGNVLGGSKLCRCKHIVELADMHGDYEPSCGGVASVILDPVDLAGGEPQITLAQVTIAEVAMESCHIEKEETAWAKGKCEFGPGWGSYFKCCLASPEQPDSL